MSSVAERLATGSARIRRDDLSAFLPNPEEVKEKLPYLLQGWNGTLRATPSASSKVIPLTAGWKALLDRGPNIEYLGSRRVGGELWLHITLTTEPRCGDTPEGVRPISGWIPAYKPNRAPTVWFSSRGC